MRISKRRPTSPGEILLHEFIEAHGLNQLTAAKAAQIPHSRLHGIINGTRGITADTALRFAKLFGTTPDLWLNLQAKVDLWDAMQSEKTAAALKEIKTLKKTA